MLLKALFLVPVLVSFAAAAYDIDLSGTVTNKSGAVLKDVIVTLEGKMSKYHQFIREVQYSGCSGGASSDFTGQFEFSVLKNGNMVFQFRVRCLSGSMFSISEEDW